MLYVRVLSTIPQVFDIQPSWLIICPTSALIQRTRLCHSLEVKQYQPIFSYPRGELAHFLAGVFFGACLPYHSSTYYDTISLVDHCSLIWLTLRASFYKRMIFIPLLSLQLMQWQRRRPLLHQRLLAPTDLHYAMHSCKWSRGSML